MTSADATLTDCELEDVLVLLIAGVTHRLKESRRVLCSASVAVGFLILFVLVPPPTRVTALAVRLSRIGR